MKLLKIFSKRFPVTQPTLNDASSLPVSLPLQTMDDLLTLETALNEDCLKEYLVSLFYIW
jgi:hypothetical protein